MNHMPNDNDTVILNLDRPRELRLGHKALKRFSALTGCTMESMEETIKSYENMSCLVYVMLSQEDSALTPEQVDDLLDKVPIREIVSKCSQAIAAAFSDPDADKGADASGGPEGETVPPAAAGVGGTASALPPPSESPYVNGST